MTGAGAWGAMFHHFHGGPHAPSQGSIDAETFERLLGALGPDRILPARLWREKALAGTLGPDEICLTFDDALRCQIDVAGPVLERLGLTAFFFVYTSIFEGVDERLEIYRHHRHAAYPSVEAYYADFEAAVARSAWGPAAEAALRDFAPAGYLAAFPFYTDADRRFRFLRDRVLGPEAYFAVNDALVAAAGYDADALRRLLWMDRADVAALHDAGHVIGLHSHTHPTDLAALTPEAQAREYGRNAEILTGMLGAAPDVVAHPCGSYGPGTLALLAGMGVRLGFRSSMAPTPGRGPLEHPREDHATLVRALGAAQSVR